MQYFIYLPLLLFFLVAGSPVYADQIPVPSAHCLSSNPCTTAMPTSAQNPTGTSVSGQPNVTSGTAQPSSPPNPSSGSTPCSSPQSALSSQNNGTVSSMSRHHFKLHHSKRRGFLQQFIQWLLQLFQKFGIQIPGLNPCNSGATTLPTGMQS